MPLPEAFEEGIPGIGTCQTPCARTLRRPGPWGGRRQPVRWRTQKLRWIIFRTPHSSVSRPHDPWRRPCGAVRLQDMVLKRSCLEITGRPNPMADGLEERSRSTSSPWM